MILRHKSWLRAVIWERHQKRHCNVGSSKRTSIDSSHLDLLKKARAKLGSLGNGKVLLEKDEASGIAVVTLDHEEKKNALSGKK